MDNCMNKNDLARIIAQKHRVTIEEGKQILSTVFDSIVDAAAQDNPYAHRGFGKFILVERKERCIHDVHTKDIIMLPKKKILRLITSRRMNKRINDHLNPDSIH